MANKIVADVEIDDKGSLKKVTDKSKKAAKALDGVAQGASNSDRNMKGASRASSNATKNFSKMAQGGGGIAGMYAQIAANVFAVSAAFMFFKDAADVSKLIAGQKALGSITGIGYKTLTKELQAATGGQLAFRDAAQAAAIGVASGLNAGQLEGLAKGARMASAALGRDLTDSFNRLVKGVTKAEPELLDELGIVLKLTTATDDYAKAIGKNVKDLSAFERSQAVAANVLGQVEEKFGKISKIMDPSAESLNRFLTSFDTLLISLKTGLTEGLAPVFNFLSRNTEALAALFAALSLVIVKSLIPNFGAYADKARKNSISVQEGLKRQQKEYEELSNSAQESADKAIKAEQAKVKAFNAGSNMVGTAGGRKAEDFLSGKSDSNYARVNAQKAIHAALEGAEDQHGNIMKGKFAGHTKAQVQEYQEIFVARVDSLDKQEKAEKVRDGKRTTLAKRTTAFIKLQYAGMYASITSMAATAAAIMSKVMLAAGWIGAIMAVAAILIGLGKEVYNFFFPLSKEAEAAESAIDSLKESLTGLNEELARMVKVRDVVTLSLTESVLQAGKAMGTADLVGKFADLRIARDNLEKGLIDESDLEKAETGFKELLQNSSKLTTGLDEVATSFATMSETKVTDVLTQVSNRAQTAAVAVEALSRGLKTASDIQNTFTGVKVDPLTALISQRTENLKNSNLNLSEAQNQTSKGGNAAANTQLEIAAKEKEYESKRHYGGTAIGEKAVLLEDIAKLKEKLAAQITLDEQRVKGIDEIEAARDLEEKKLASLLALQAKYTKNITDGLKLRKKIAESMKVEYNIQDKIDNLSTEKTGIRLGELALANKLLIAEDALNNAKGPDETKIAKEAVGALKDEQTILQATNALKEKQKQLQIDIATIQKAHGIDKIIQDEQELKLKSKLNEQLDKQAQAQTTLNNLAQKSVTNNSEKAGINAQLNSSVGTYVFDAENKAEKRRIETERALIVLKEAQLLRDQTVAQAKLSIEKSQFDLAQKRVAMELAMLNKQRNIQGLDSKGLTVSDRTSLDNIQDQSNIDFNQAGQAITATFSVASEAIKKTNLELDLSTKNLGDITQIANAAAKSFEDGLGNAFAGIIDGTKSVSEAFSDMAQNILKSISQIISQKLAASIIGGMFPGPTKTVPVSESYLPEGFRYGGVVNSSGKLPGYAVGGIARGSQGGYPVELHGTEAVVPLPNGRSIPVEMSGSNSNNSVVVNVSVDGKGGAQTTTEAQSSEQAGQLGKMVAQAVQKELQNQKRSGGILNPYGVA